MQKVTFSGKSDFYPQLKKKVNAYFDEKKINKTGNWRLFIKTGFSLTMLITTYLTYLLFATEWWHVILLATAFGIAGVLISFNIMHDACHGSYSQSSKVNYVLGYAANLIGGSQILWRKQHNVLHHMYTNIEGMDTDLGNSFLFRLAPYQKRRKWHSLQFIYAFFLYGLLLLSWFFSDLFSFFSHNYNGHKIAKPNKRETFWFVFFKLFYIGYAIVLPLFFLPVWAVLTFFFVKHFVLGFVMSIIFQLAHVTTEVEFPQPNQETGEVSSEWAIHQIQTTADFATKSRFLNFFCGGLNFQVVHHLFGKISHIHYRHIQKIVKEHCKEYNVPYHEFKSFSSALGSHIKLLFKLGRKEKLA